MELPTQFLRVFFNLIKMKANELRLGNYINHKYCGNIEIDFNSLRTVDKEELQVNIEKCHKPIRLTEEWLLKFGADKTPQLFDYFSRVKYHNYFIIHDYNTIASFSISEFGYFDCLVYKHVKYVHQLQNLYFALTGEELTIKK